MSSIKKWNKYHFGVGEHSGLLFQRCALGVALAGCFGAAHGADPVPEADLPVVRVTGAVDPVAERLNPPVTVGSKVPVAQREISQSVSVITQEQIQQQQLNTIDDAVRYVPGVKVNGGNYFSRGFQVTTMLLDGVPTSLTDTSIYSSNNTLLNQYERIEFLRGPDGLYSGFGGAGGTLSLVRKMPTKDFHMAAELAAGTRSTYRSSLDVGGPISENGALRGRFVVAGQTEDLDTHDTWRNNQQVYGVLQADLSSRMTLTVGGSYDRMYSKPPLITGVPGFSDYTLNDISPRNDLYQSWNRQRAETTNLFSRLETQLGSGWKNTTAVNYMSRTNMSKYSTVPSSVDPLTNNLTLFNLKNNFKDEQVDLDSFVSGPMQLFGRTHILTVGANYVRKRGTTSINYCSPTNFACPVQTNLNDFNSHTAEPDFDGPINESVMTIRQYGFYGNGRFSLADPLTLIVGGRVSWWDISNDPRDGKNPFGADSSTGDYNAKVTPYAGLVYDINKNHSIYTSYTNIFQPQAARDSSNNLIKPLEGEQYEAGLKSEFYDGRLNTSFAVFQIKQKNQATLDPNDPTQQFSIANGKSRSRGVEMTATGEVARGLTVSGGYTYTNTKLLDDSNPDFQFSQIAPKHLFKLWSAYQLPGDLNQWTVGAGTYISSKVSASDGEGSWVQGGYATFDAMIKYQINSRTSVALNGTNLFNRRYYDKVVGPSDNTYGQLRRVLLTLRYQM